MEVDTHILLMDNCPSHKSEITLKILRALKIPTIFTASASFKAVPVEALFAALKMVDFSEYEQLSASELH